MSQCSFCEVARLHAAAITAAGLSLKTIDWYGQQFLQYDRWRIQQGHPDIIPSAEVFEEYLSHERRRGLRPATVNALYRSLATIINFAIQRRMLDRASNPLEYMRPPRIPKERPPYVLPADMRALLNACSGYDWLDNRDATILCLLFYSGLRLGEVCALEIADIDLARMEVFVQRGKGAKPRTVPLAQEVRQPLLDYLYTRPGAGQHLLLSATAQGNSKGPLTPEGLRMMLRRRCTQAGTPVYSAHKFRHGFAMWLRNNGTDLSDIAAAMGHTTTQVTQLYYAHTLPPTVHKAYNAALERLREGE